MFLLPLLVLWVLPVAAFFVAVPVAGSAEKSDVAASSSGVVTVGSRLVDGRQSVEAAFALVESVSVTVPQSGIITSIDVRPGDTIATGMQLARINGSPVYASVGGVPVYRDISSGARGPDVAAVAGVLAAQGFLSSADIDNAVGPKIRAAISAFQKAIGVPVTGVFSASNVAFVPAASATVGKVATRVGATVSIGGDLLTLAQAPESVTVKASGAEVPLTHLAEAELTATVGENVMDLSTLAPTGDELATFYAFVAAHGTKALADGSPTDSVTYSGVLLALKTPIDVGTVPAAAVLGTATGSLCVFVVDEKQASPVPVPDSVPLSGELGIVTVPTTLVGKNVLADASTAPESMQTSCT